MVGGFYLNMHPSFVPTLFPCLSDILNHLFRFSCLVVIPFHVQVCKTMSIIGYDPSESAIQTLDESLQRQLLADIDELKVLAPSVLDRRLAELCK